MIKKVKDYLISSQYEQIDINLSNVCVYMIAQNDKCKLCIISDYTDDAGYNEEKIKKINEIIIKNCEDEGYLDLSCMSINFVRDNLDNKQILSSNVISIYVNDSRKEIIKSNIEEQKELVKVFKKELYDISLIAKHMAKGKEVIIKKQSKEECSDKLQRGLDFGTQKGNILYYISYSTIHIVIINVAIHIWLLITCFVDNSLYIEAMHKLGLGFESVTNDLQIYRLLTCMFVHSDEEHLLNNMLSLFVIGMSLEKMIGRKKLLFIYFSTGIIAGLTSISYNMIAGNYNVLSVGASGAVFGLMGVMVTFLFINRDKFGEIGVRRFIIYALLSLYTGFASDNIDNAAHVGGFVGGIIVSMIVLYILPRIHKK